jgi:hypothetical protein
LERNSLNTHGPPDDVGLAAKAALPEAIAEHSHRALLKLSKFTSSSASKRPSVGNAPSSEWKFPVTPMTIPRINAPSASIVRIGSKQLIAELS